MTLIIVVAALGAVGAVARAVTARILPPLIGTLAVNLGAAFLLGLSASWTGIAADGFRIGLLGAASTWSTLANEVARLLDDRRYGRAATYLMLSLGLGVSAAWAGLQLCGS